MPLDLKVLAYRMMHAALPCAAMKCAKQHKPKADAVCLACKGHPGTRRGGCTETYTHLFVECPVYRPAVEWLLELWHKIAGVRPPLTAEVLVADDPAAWEARPKAQDRHQRMDLWRILRLTVLYCIWEARCSTDRRQRTAAAVVRHAVRRLRDEMEQQWIRDQHPEIWEHHAPTRIMQTHRALPREDAMEMWTKAGLCTCHTPGAADGGNDGGGGGAAPARAASDTPRLDIHLTAQHPVAAPPDPPAAAGSR